LILAATVAAPALSAAQDPAADPAAPGDPVVPGVTAPPAAPDPAAVQPPKPDKDAGEADEQATEAAPPEPQPAAAATTAEPRAAKTGPAKASATASVSVGDNFFSPASVSVNVGDSVTWRNTGAAPHSATANNGSFDTGVFASGQSRSHTFTRAGTFTYFCTVHGASQSGTVRVASTGGGGGGGDGADASSGSSEAAAVASPDAAGTSTSLPATGFAAGGLGLVGFALLGAGTALRRREKGGRLIRLHSLF
jgi:LPXTG-motif cell wall-anchored protein